jgi:hypothetical protein
MKEPYYEDLANHVDPAPNGGCGNTMADARVGESAGGLLSSEITVTRVPTSLPEREGHTDHSVPASAGKASCGRTLRSRRTWHARKPHERESGYPRGTQYFKRWNRRIHSRKISRCIGSSPGPMQAWNTKTGYEYGVGRRRCNAASSVQKASRKSDTT